jgi:hypothetical protein
MAVRLLVTGGEPFSGRHVSDRVAVVYLGKVVDELVPEVHEDDVAGPDGPGPSRRRC